MSLLRCPFDGCRSRVISAPEKAVVLVENAPEMLVCGGSDPPTLGSGITTGQFYELDDMWAFDNIGVSRSTEGVYTTVAEPVLPSGERITVDRFLTCADCDRGPLGFAGLKGGAAAVAAGDLDARVLEAQALCYYLSVDACYLDDTAR